MQEHDLKTDPWVFEAINTGAMTCQIRRNDRGFSPGDMLRLRETKFTGAEMAAGAPLEYTGRQMARKITHMLTGPVYGIAAGWSILSLSSPPTGYAGGGEHVASAASEAFGDGKRLTGDAPKPTSEFERLDRALTHFGRLASGRADASERDDILERIAKEQVRLGGMLPLLESIASGRFALHMLQRSLDRSYAAQRSGDRDRLLAALSELEQIKP